MSLTHYIPINEYTAFRHRITTRCLGFWSKSATLKLRHQTKHVTARAIRISAQLVLRFPSDEPKNIRHFCLHNHFYLSWTASATARGRDTTSSLDRRCDCTDGWGGRGGVQSSIIQHWSGRSKAKRSIHSVQIENSLARYCGQVLCSKRSTINEHSEESFVKQWR